MTTKRIATRADCETMQMAPGRARLWRIADTLKRGGRLAALDRAFLAAALAAIARGADPAEALASLLPKGRPQQTNAEYEKQWGIAEAVETLRAQGRSRPEAFAIIGKARHLHPDTIERYHARHGRSVRSLRAMAAKIEADHAALAAMVLNMADRK